MRIVVPAVPQFTCICLCRFCCQVTVVSVASPPSNTSQKSVALPVNVALGQQILVQQPTSASPVKVPTSQSTAQVRPAAHLHARLHVCVRCCDVNLRHLFYLGFLRVSNLSSLWLWEESPAPSSRPSSRLQPSPMYSRFRYQEAGSTTSASSRRPQLAAQDIPVVPAPALYRQVNICRQTWMKCDVV